jgi:hypothetical protein
VGTSALATPLNLTAWEGHSMTSPETAYRTIPLTKGYHTLVDEADYHALVQWSWCVSVQRAWRAVAVRRAGGLKQSAYVYMHRQIMGLGYGDRRLVDHINGDPLDNRRCNLRIATFSENGMNRGAQPNKYIAQIAAKGRRLYLGLYPTPEEAHQAYCQKAAELHAEFARTA